VEAAAGRRVPRPLRELSSAARGAGVVIHSGATLGPKFGVTPADVLAALGGTRQPTPGESEATLARAGVTVVHAAEALPGCSALAELRDEVGPRGPVHPVERLVDWFWAQRFVVGDSYQPYRERLLGALALLGARQAIAVLKRAPDRLRSAGRRTRGRASGAASRWRDLDSNRGHHDFQGVGVRPARSRTPCKSLLFPVA
jgi:hypothetical protein